MHYDSVHGCIFACCSHIVPSHTIDFLLSPCDEVTNIMRETLPVEASLAAGTGECCPYSWKWVKEWPWLGAVRLDFLSCIQENGILHLMIILVFLILWIIDWKSSNLICCMPDYSGNILFSGCESPVCTVTYTGKMALIISSCASNSIWRHFSFSVCTSVFFCNMSPLLIKLDSGIEKNQKINELFS